MDIHRKTVTPLPTMMAFVANGDPCSNCFIIVDPPKIDGDTKVQPELNLAPAFPLILMVSWHGTEMAVEIIIAKSNAQQFDDCCYHNTHHNAKLLTVTALATPPSPPTSHNSTTITKSHIDLVAIKKEIHHILHEDFNCSYHSTHHEARPLMLPYPLHNHPQ